MISGFDLKGYAGVPGYIPEGAAVLEEYDSQKPSYFSSLAKARGWELGRVLLMRKPNWAGVRMLDSSECAYYLMFNAPEGLELKDNLINPYKVVIDAMNSVSEFIKSGKVKIGKMKGRHGMRYLAYE